MRSFTYTETKDFIYPKQVCIETYHGCNARCGFCPVTLWTRPKGQMSDEIFNTVIDQLKEWAPGNVNKVALMMNGEPLLDSKLEDRLAICKAEGLPNVGFTTNGSLMNLERASSILGASPDYVVFSFDTLEKKSYEDNRRGLSYDTTLENIFGFIRKRNELKSKTRVVLRYVDFQEGGAGFKDYQLYFQDFLDEELDELQYTIAHNAGFRQSIKEELDNGNFGTTPCDAPFNRLIIQHDGQVLMCAHDFNTEYDLGNVMEKHILEIFNGDEFNRVRQVHKACRRNTLVKCSTCDEPELDKDENTFVKYTPSGKSFFSKNNVGFDYHEERRKILD